MNYQVFDLIAPYLNKDIHIFPALVCKGWNHIINDIKQTNEYKTPYNVLILQSLLSYSEKNLKLVINENVKEVIIKLGNLDTIKSIELYNSRFFSFLQNNTIKLSRKNYMRYAIESGNLENMKWLKTNGCGFDGNQVATKDHMSWLQDNGCHFNSAATNGNLENMKWLKLNGCPFNFSTFNYAARNGNLENMKWLKSNGCHFNYSTFYEAAKYGNLDNMKWLFENGCDFNMTTFIGATRNGNLDNIQWLTDNGCHA